MAIATSDKSTKGATILHLSEYLKKKKVLPASWYKAAGMAKHMKKELEQHAKDVRGEWDK